MADIRPFCGVHYNPALVKDLSKVLCPPYDVITPQMQQELYNRSERNFVRIEFGREMPSDKDTDNRYTRAAATLGKWLEQGVLATDKKPAVYITDHRFTYQGKDYRRRSMTCLVKLEEWDRMVVRPHEGTQSKPKGDRASLLWALNADASPILGLYDGSGTPMVALLDEQTTGKPLLSADDIGGESFRLWMITDKEVNRQIADCLAERPLYIADGHHRYESALTYRRERRTTTLPVEEEEPFDFVMMTLVDFADPGLVILPSHRLVRGLSKSALDILKAGLDTCFDIKRFSPDRNDMFTQVNSLLTAEKGEIKLVLYGLSREELLLLRLKNLDIIGTMIPYFHSELYQKLDVSIVDHVILEELLGLPPDNIKTFIEYTNDAVAAIRSVVEKEYQLAVIVSPVKPEVIKAIADSGDRMPRKSTYFYPKTPAGLVLYRFGK
ncbi:MAG: DUF1015 domain-containing protein [Dehalococcoidales bacterium]|nr:DUF1015 domain-containing protein [Dehalococcoidales bacterium]